MKTITPQQSVSRVDFRVPARIPASLTFPPRAQAITVQGVTRDIGFGGACIESSDALPQEGMLARLTLEGPRGSPVIIDALVLRSSHNGIGLMFAHYGDDVFRPLVALLQPEFEKYIGFGARSGGADDLDAAAV